MLTAFPCETRVRVKIPGQKAFIGTAYSEYQVRGKGERFICVTKPSGAGVAYRIRYVRAIRTTPRRKR